MRGLTLMISMTLLMRLFGIVNMPEAWILRSISFVHTKNSIIVSFDFASKLEMTLSMGILAIPPRPGTFLDISTMRSDVPLAELLQIAMYVNGHFSLLMMLLFVRQV